MNRTTLKIDGMSCGHCVASVKKALEQIDGVSNTQVAVGTAAVEFDAAVTTEAELAAAVTAAGYAAAPSA